MYEWDPKTTGFTLLGDLLGACFRANCSQLLAVLAKQPRHATRHELLADWPADQPRPSAVTLNQWLNRACEAGLICREGCGCKGEPYRYWVENRDNLYFHRGDLPPFRGPNWRVVVG